MADERLLTVRDASIMLGISEKEVLDLAEVGALPAYKVGGVYLRFKREQVEAFHKKFRPAQLKIHPEKIESSADRFRDFWYFNDFYIWSAIIIVLIIFIILRGY